jgi:hypothetical protein
VVLSLLIYGLADSLPQKTKKNLIMKTMIELYAESNSSEEHKKLSLINLAGKMGCTPNEVKDLYFKQITLNDFEKKDIEIMAKQWELKKQDEAKFFKINPDDTTAALMSDWANEYIRLNY